jgi:hypothetical protein
MKKILSSKVLLAVLAILMVSFSLYLLAATPQQIMDTCGDQCEGHPVGGEAWFACWDGCLFAAVG